MIKQPLQNMPSEEAPMLEWALYYAGIGIPVFPIKPRTKDKYYEDREHLGKPTKQYPKGTPYSWKEQATTDTEQIKKAFTKHPDANIGGVTGNGFYGLDRDERESGSGSVSIAKWEKEGILPGKVNLETWTSITGSGSNQFFYYLSPELVQLAREHGKNYAGDADMIEPGSHVDTRGDGRYVVLPPSTHPNGRKYMWDTKKNPATIQIADFDKTIEYLFEHKSTNGSAGDKKETALRSLANGEKVPKGSRRAYMLSRVGQLVHKLMDICDDNAIVAAAMQIARNDLDTTVPLDSGWDGLQRDIESMVYDMRYKILKDREEGTWTDYGYNVNAWRLEHPGEEPPTPINWAEMKAAGDRLRAKEAAAKENKKEDPGKPEPVADPYPDLITITANDLLKKEIPPLKYVIEGLLPAGFGLLAAPPKSFKSFLCLQICVAVCQGVNILGRSTNKTRCLYYDLESGNRRPQQRLIDMGLDMVPGLDFVTREELQEYQKRRGIDEPLTLANGFAEVLDAHLKRNPDIGLVIVDVFGKIRTEQKRTQQLYEHDYADVGKLQAITTRHNVCILAAHHTTKGKDENNPYNNMGGSTGLFGAADFAWIINKTKFSDKEATLHTAGRDIEQNELAITWDSGTLNWQYKGTAEEVQAAKDFEEYEQSAVVNAIRILLRTSQGRWQGTVTEIIKASQYYSQHIYDSPQKVGKDIDKFEPLLLKKDGIRIDKGRDKGKSRDRIMTIYKADRTSNFEDEIKTD